MVESFKLSSADHERYFRDIETDLMRHTQPVSQPIVVITGGQPGSGKSKLLEQSKKDFSDGNVVVINGDDLRDYHPQAEEIFRLDDNKFAERTDPDCREWTKKLFERAIETKRNIVFESTMREAGPISKDHEAF
jgi:predicted ABC-type ATPase